MKVEKEYILDLTRELDPQCLNIARVLLIGLKRYRFNELHRYLNENGIKMSKPTLSDHLKHLKKKKLALRKVEGVQNVTYVFNFNKLDELGEPVEEPKAPDEVEEMEKEFNSLSLDEQLTQILYCTMSISLDGLRSRLLNTIEPERSLIRNLQLMLSSRTYDFYEKLLLDKCSINKEYAHKVLEKIDSYRREFREKRFGSLDRSGKMPKSGIVF